MSFWFYVQSLLVKKRTTFQRLRAAWRELRRSEDSDATGSTVQSADVWTQTQVAALHDYLCKTSNRELRLLLLFCEGRTAISGTELTTKFGCGNPMEHKRDLPAIFDFCTSNKISAPYFPIHRSTTELADSKPTYELGWARSEARHFAALQLELLRRSRT